MKKLLLFLFFAISLNAFAGTLRKNIEFQFFENDYEIYVENGITNIASKMGGYWYIQNDKPGLPAIYRDVKIQPNEEYKSHTFSVKKRLIKSGIKIGNTPMPLPTMKVEEESVNILPQYGNYVYPEQNCMMTSASKWDELTVLHFMICPFEYDSSSGDLYLIDSLQINIELTEKSDVSETRRSAPEYILNKYGIESESAVDLSLNDYSNMKENELEALASDNNTLDYLIITDLSLKDSFLPLQRWKMTKGVRTEIITVQEIDNEEIAPTLQLKIKQYLKNQFTTRNLKYVLLGGSDDLIPSLKCFVRVFRGFDKDTGESIYTTEDNMPSDIFYACFGGRFDWDKNGNGIYGELTDGVDFTADLLLSRLPVSSIEETTNIVNKILSYEQTPLWNNTMLMTGVKLKYTYDAVSDVQYRSEWLYDNRIKPYWTGVKYRFYDTGTDFEGGAEFNVTKGNLQSLLSQGFSIVNMGTHRSKKTWAMEVAPSYSTTEAEQCVSAGHSIIVTEACDTNAFDYEECLSKSFMIGKDNGVVAYWGSSRSGWFADSRFPNYSSELEQYFYDKLFSTQVIDKSFGNITTLAKNEIAYRCNDERCYRWLQLGVNAIGDPEMPIYTEIPQFFNAKKIVYTKNQSTGAYTFKASSKDLPDGTKVCMMSKQDGGKKVYVITEAKNGLVTLPASSVDCTVCFTRNNYMPYIVELKNGYAFNSHAEGVNKILSCVSTSNNSIIVTTSISDNAKDATLSVLNLSGENKNSVSISCGESINTIDTSKLASGVYVIKLEVDGVLYDGIQTVKK